MNTEIDDNPLTAYFSAAPQSTFVNRKSLSLSAEDSIGSRSVGVLDNYEAPKPVYASVRAIDSREPMTMCEEYYFNLIKRHVYGDTISMKTLQSRIATDYDYIDTFLSNMKKSVVTIGVSQGYFQKANWQQPAIQLVKSAKNWMIAGIAFAASSLLFQLTRLDFMFGGIFILAAAMFYAAYYLKQNSHKYVLLTEFGEQEYQKWRGLYNFLKSDTLMNERTIVELPLWEKYLVYATAFDISEKVIAAMNIRCPEAKQQTQSIVSKSYTRSGSIRISGRRFHSSVRHTSHAGRSSGGFGGGGFGYGGGGRGGGSGGGGH